VQTKNLQYYQSYVQFINPTLSSTKDFYESFTCSIENLVDYTEVNYETMRVSQHCGIKNFGDITTGGYEAVSDESNYDECAAWTLVYERSLIDNKGDGDESVICVLKRDSISSFSKMDFKRSSKYSFYVGFNVWSSVNSSQRLTGGVSRRLEFRLEDAKDSSFAF